VTSLLIAVQDAVEWKDRGVATSSSMFFRTIGGALMAGILGSLLAENVGGAVPESDLAKMLGPDRTLGLAKEKLASYALVLREAMGPLFLVILGCALVAIAVGFAFPAVRVKPREGVGAGGAPRSAPLERTPAVE
jgi:hypothetical protein